MARSMPMSKPARLLDSMARQGGASVARGRAILLKIAPPSPTAPAKMAQAQSLDVEQVTIAQAKIGDLGLARLGRGRSDNRSRADPLHEPHPAAICPARHAAEIQIGNVEATRTA
jgi:hypothetical protein